VSLITPLMGYARIRHLLPTLLHPHGASTLSKLNPQPPAAAPAHRLRAATWMNGSHGARRWASCCSRSWPAR
jgi:hypothetical protein